jgi:RNA polymerase sigma-70 factor, ECF subfamily
MRDGGAGGGSGTSGRVDLALVEAARSGDREAFSRLYETFAPMIHGIALVRLTPAEADDVVQEVFLTALERIDTLRDPAAIGSWLAMIARTRAVDLRRASSRIADRDVPEGVHEDPDRVEAARALAAIRALPEAYRETLVLRLVEGMTGPEIAERTGLTPESVRVNLHRGMKLLREKLGT